METVIHLMRHGQVHNPDNLRYGHIPGFRLSDRGRAQARLAAAMLRAFPLAEIIASPLERAVETAEIVARELGLPAPTTDERLIEPPNQFDGLSRNAQLRPWLWPRLRNPFLPSWAEPFADVATRMRSIIEAQRARHLNVLLVTHQTPIWLARHAYEGAWGPPWLVPVHCTPASVTSLYFARRRYLGYRYWSPPEITVA